MGPVGLLDGILRAAVLASYILIAAELVFLPVPSEVSAIALLKSGRRRGSLLWIALLLEVGLSALALAWCLAPGIRSRLLPLGGEPHAALQAAATAAVLSGSALSLAAVLQLRSSPGGLYTGGLFSLSRNPIQLGANLTWAGWAMAAPSVVMTLALLFYLCHKHRRILMEEARLQRIYGGRYRDYRSTVRRYLGRRGGRARGLVPHRR